MKFVGMNICRYSNIKIG